MSSGHGQTAVMWSHSIYYSMYPIETQARQSIGMKRWGDNHFSSLDPKLLALDSSWESERNLSLRTWSLLRWPWSSGKLHIQEYMCTTDWTGKKSENADKVGWVEIEEEILDNQEGKAWSKHIHEILKQLKYITFYKQLREIEEIV